MSKGLQGAHSARSFPHSHRSYRGNCYKRRGSLDVSLWQELREAGQDETIDEEPLPPEPKPEPLPHLTPAGAEPEHKQETSHV